MDSSSDLGSPLRGHCGICGDPIKAREECIQLLQMKDSRKPFHCLDLCNYPCTEDVRLPREEWPGLLDNAASPAAIVHLDCFKTVRRRRRIDDERLWMAAIRVTPWPWAPTLHLRRDYIPLDSSLADGLGLGILRELPSEIGVLVYENSSDCLLWRYNACLNTARRLRASAPEELSTSVSNVVKWERGAPPSLAPQPDERAKVRLTFDAFGLKRIEHFEEDPRHQARRSESHAFIILEPHEARSTKVHFKFQHARLELHETCYGFKIWDTPSRPSPVRYFVSPDPMQMQVSTHLRTIELDKITGLTFFVNYTDIYAIHAHTPSSPFAGPSYPQSSVCQESMEDTILWVYVPIPEGDSVTAIGRRTVAETSSVWLFLRLKLAGDVVFGFAARYDGLGPFETVSSPTTLIHDLRGSNPGPLNVLGVHNGDGLTTAVSPLSSPVPSMQDLRHVYLAYTSAPLQNVQRLRVFRCRKRSWRGMILYYKNGAQRSVGQCRVGIDNSTPYDDPRGICLVRGAAFQHSESESNDEFYAGDAVIRTGGQCEHESSASELYRCRPLVGELGVWFSWAFVRISVIE